MLTAAWIFMGIAIIASVALLGDLKKEQEYNYNIMIYSRRTEGGRYGTQETADRYDREILYRCS